MGANICDDYRFGFQGQEKDDEVYGSTGTSYTAMFWQYDSRIGRRWNVDPEFAKVPYLSSYSAFNNNPIIFVDPDGDIFIIYYDEKNEKGEIVQKKVTFDGVKAINEDGSDYISDTAPFVDDVIEAYNYFINNGADVHGIMSTVVTSEKITHVKEAELDEDIYNSGTNTIYWDSDGGLVIDVEFNELDERGYEKEPIVIGRFKGNQSPAIGLFNETAGAYTDEFMTGKQARAEGFRKGTIKDADGKLSDENWQIKQESIAIDILNSKGKNETKRVNEACFGCTGAEMKGPTSTKLK